MLVASATATLSLGIGLGTLAHCAKLGGTATTVTVHVSRRMVFSAPGAVNVPLYCCVCAIPTFNSVTGENRTARGASQTSGAPIAVRSVQEAPATHVLETGSASTVKLETARALASTMQRWGTGRGRSAMRALRISSGLDALSCAHR